jgi:PAS domain S-box-containing protein
MFPEQGLSMWAADGDAVSLWWVAAAGAFGTVLTAAVTAAVTLLTQLRLQAKQKRVDALQEWQEIAERQQADLDRMTLEQRMLRENYERDAREAREREQKCQIQVARMEGDIKLLESTVRRLQRLAGDEPPATIIPGLIVADVRGVIRVASPAITVLLHYLPGELVGKNVEMLMPERYKEAHRNALATVAAKGQAPWPEKAVIGDALTKEGDEVPVIITLSGWQTASGDWLVSAEIRPRKTEGEPGAMVKGGGKP